MNQYELILNLKDCSRVILFNADNYVAEHNILWAISGGSNEKIAEFSEDMQWTIVKLSSKTIGGNK